MKVTGGRAGHDYKNPVGRMPRGRSPFTKRQKEQTRQQRQRDKAERKNLRKQDQPASDSVDEAVARIAPPLVNSRNRVAADFLRIDSEVALTFSGIALAATDETTKRRTTLAALTAYNSIARLRGNIELTVAERDKLDANLQRVKTELQSLGQIL